MLLWFYLLMSKEHIFKAPCLIEKQTKKKQFYTISIVNVFLQKKSFKKQNIYRVIFFFCVLNNLKPKLHLNYFKCINSQFSM